MKVYSLEAFARTLASLGIALATDSALSAPLIAAFNPISAPAGATVSLSGADFSAVPTNNIVYFGAARATVLAATSNLLTVVVPAGATYAPITETVSGLTAYSKTPFLVTYSGSGTIDSSSLAPRVDLGAGDGPYWVRLGDMDGDGKIDLVVAHAYSANVYVLRNTSTNGALTATGSFAPPVILEVGGGRDSLYGLALADLDGDGRLDVVVANRNSNNITIFRNLSLPNVLSSNSFATRVDFSVGLQPIDLAIGDLDGDGKPDLATPNFESGTVSVLRNTSTIGSISLAPEIELAGGNGARGIAIGDLDGDGKPEIVVANGSGASDTTSVFQNISTPGSLTTSSFAARVDFAGGGEMPAIGDLDGDGRPDLAVGSWQRQALSVFRNTGSAGVINSNSFAARVDFSVGANVHHLAIGDVDGDGRPDITVVGELPSQLSIFKNTSVAGTISPGSFGPRVDFATGWNADGVALGDLDGDGRPDIAFGAAYDNIISLYRNVIPFTNAPPPTNCVAPPSGLVSWWAGQGNALDSGDSDQGTLAGNTTFGPGRVGQAFVFDGSSDAVIVGSAPNLQLQDFTIECWIKRSDSTVATFGSHTTALFFGYGSLGYGFGIWDDGRLFLTRVDIDNVSSTVSIADTNFHHVAVTKSGTSVAFYIDGVAYPAPVYGNTFTFSSVAAIGARADTMDDSFLGTIDELAVYSRGLSPAEILSIYNADGGGKCRDAVGPRIISQPGDQLVYVGDTTTITVGVNGDSPLSYQWRFNGGDLAGQTNSSLTLSNVQTNNAGLYSVFVTNIAGSLLSSNALLTVNPRPPCTSVPQGVVSWWRGETNAFDAADNNHGTLLGNVTYGPGRVGEAFVFDGNADAVQVGNPANLQLQDFTIETWIKRASPSIAGFGSHTDALFFGYGSGGYGFGMYDDGRLFLTRVDIDNVTLGTGITDTNSFHHLAVTKSNTTVVFYIDGAAYPVPPYSTTYTFSTVAAIGARVDTLNDSFVGAIDELAVYNRALSSTEILAIYNADGSGKCKVPIPPAIVSQPISKTAYVGDTVTFNVVASGDPPLAYQWMFAGTNLPGHTANSLTLSNVQFTNAGNYSVLVSNLVDSVLSSNALLTVIPRPPCAPAPDGLVSWWRAENDSTDGWDSNNGQLSVSVGYQAGKVGRAFSFTSGYILVPDSTSLRITNALTIEAWVNPSTVAGTGARTILSKFEYPFSQTLLNQSSYFLGTTNNGSVVFLLSGSGSSRTNTALVSSQVLPANQWSFIVATYDGSAMRIYINGSLAAQTNYSGNIFPGNNNLSMGSIPFSFPPGTSAAWPFAGLIDELSLYNRALASNEVQSIYSSDVTGKCLAPPIITQQPADQAVPAGEDALFSVSVAGSRPLKYQWRFKGQILPAATNATLLLEHVQSNRAGIYSVAVTNALGFALSSNATLSILPPLACVAAPPGAISWWPADGSGVDVVGTNKATVSGSGIILPPLPLSPYATGKVSLAFNLSNNFAINRGTTAIFVSNSPSLNFGSNADFSIEAWIKVIPSVNLSPYTTIIDKRSVTPPNGIGYSLLLNQGRLACWLASAPSSLTNASMFVSSGPDLRDGMFHHVALTLNRTATNGGNLFVDGQSVLTFNPTARRGDLSTTASFLIGSSAGTLPFGSTSNTFFNGLIDELAIYNRALSGAEVLAIRQAGAAGKCKGFPIILTQPASQRVTINSNVALSVTAGGVLPLRYQWFHNGVAQSNATNSSYSFVFQLSSAGSYFVRVTNIFGTATSSNFLLTINNPPAAQPQQVTLNEDTPAAITLHGVDPQLDPLSYSIVIPPAHGSLLGLPPNLTYVPATNYFGPDAFTFKVNDGLADSPPATVSLTVLSINDAPVAIPQSLSVNEDTPLNITLAGSDVENDPLTFNIVIPPAHGVLSGAPPNVTYLAFTNYNGKDSFTFQASDGRINSMPATISITVIPVNDAPIAVATVSPLFALSPEQTNLLVLSLNNSNAAVVLDGSASTDVENDPLTFSWIEGTNTIGVGVKATNVFSIGSHDVTLQVSDGNDVGSDAVSFEVITPAESVYLLISLLEENANRKLAQPLEATLNAAAMSFARGNFISAINQLQAFQNKVRAQVAATDPAFAAELIHAAQEIIDALRTP